MIFVAAAVLLAFMGSVGRDRSTGTSTTTKTTGTPYGRSRCVKNDWSDEETNNPLRADDRNFYKVEKWTKDGLHVEAMICAGNNLDKAGKLFADTIKHRPRIRLTIRQRTRVLQQWPEE